MEKYEKLAKMIQKLEENGALDKFITTDDGFCITQTDDKMVIISAYDDRDGTAETRAETLRQWQEKGPALYVCYHIVDKEKIS